MWKLFATAPADLIALLQAELQDIGVPRVDKPHPQGVPFQADIALAYRVCLWSRLANRVYRVILEQHFEHQAHLRQALCEFDWATYLTPRHSFAVSFSGEGLGVTHTHFGALLIKDGIVDYCRERFGRRPNVDTEQPDIQIHGHLNRHHLTLSLDLTGYSLHQRGYRQQSGEAPLKENVAAAILKRVGWPAIAQQGGSLFDPVCGSGTFLIEAAWMAGDVAPGLLKAEKMQLTRSLDYQPALWQVLIAEAQARQAAGRARIPLLYGADQSAEVLTYAQESTQRAGCTGLIHYRQQTLAQGRRWGDWPTGLVISNPPYGERLGDATTVPLLYQHWGELLKRDFLGWQAAILIRQADWGLSIGVKAQRRHAFANGPLACTLLRFKVEPQWFRQPALAGGQTLASQIAQQAPEWANGAGAQMFANRLRKNQQRLRRWLEQQGIQAYRLYDADMPEYALAIDGYNTIEQGFWWVVSEYLAPKTVNEGQAKRRRQAALAVLPDVLRVDPSRILYKQRQRQRGQHQYERLQTHNQWLTLQEGNARFRVNLSDYLDSGIFLDHRGIRRYLAQLAAGKRLLNLFCYTATATVQAALAGAKGSLSIDLSQTYLKWAQDNFALNGLLPAQHELLHADVLTWLQAESQRPQRRLYEVIFFNPPSFSTSKRMATTLDIQRDHLQLLQWALSLLKPNGVLLFSTHRQPFHLHSEALSPNWHIQEVTKLTLPPDFTHRHAYRAWLLQARP